MKHDPDCIFCKIVAGEVPSRKVRDEDDFIVFHDISPWAPVHVLMVTKEHIATMYDAGPEHAPLWGRMLALAPGLMRELGATNGYRMLVNTGPDGLQEVQHVHIHLIGGPRPWSKG